MITVQINVGIFTSNTTIHTWITVTGPDGVKHGYGFYPSGNLIDSPGVVKDDTPLSPNASSGPIPISQDEYGSLMDYINRTTADPPTYSLPSGAQCTNWALAGLAEAKIIPPVLGPSMDNGLLQTLLFNPLFQYIGFKDYQNINKAIDAIKALFGRAEGYYTTGTSPLILDLDGDGVETTGVKAGTYFDHGDDGFVEQTGWVGQDDGLLVLDRNGNGSIDSGAELFGNSTLLANGQKAANGFAALAELDQNHDGLIDIQDADFADLRVWKDADGDGISRTNELLSLTEAGVQSIATGSTASILVDANNNAHKEVGSFTRTDDTTATVTDVWFDVDRAHSIAKEWLDVPDDIAALPDAKGYGQVYDLQLFFSQTEPGVNPVFPFPVIPAKAGIQCL